MPSLIRRGGRWWSAAQGARAWAGGLAQPLPMSLPAAMQHLGVLEAAGLVRSEKVGRVRTCAIQPQALSHAEQWINARRIEWEHRLDRLGDYLKTLENEGDGD